MHIRPQPSLMLAALAVLSATLLPSLRSPAEAQECMVKTSGPVSLASRQSLTVCATNLDAARSVRLGVAVYDAIDARAPLTLEHFDLAQGAGACTGFRPAAPSTVIVRAGYVGAAEDPALPIASSVQVKSDFDRNGVVDAADFVVWRSSFGDPPPV